MSLPFLFLYFGNLFCLREHNENKTFCLFCVIPAKNTWFAFITSNCYALFFIFYFFLNISIFNTTIFNISIIFLTLFSYSFYYFWRNKTYLLSGIVWNEKTTCRILIQNTSKKFYKHMQNGTYFLIKSQRDVSKAIFNGGLVYQSRGQTHS